MVTLAQWEKSVRAHRERQAKAETIAKREKEEIARLYSPAVTSTVKPDGLKTIRQHGWRL